MPTSRGNNSLGSIGRNNAKIGIVEEDVALGQLVETSSLSPSPRFSRPGLSSSISFQGSPTNPLGRSTGSPLGTTRGNRVRSRTSTISYTPPLPPVMSRENSLEDVSEHFGGSLPTPHSDHQPTGRKASKSISNGRPTLNGSLTPQRTHSYHAPSLSATAMPIPSLLVSPTDHKNPRTGLKRRTSTPSLVAQKEENEAGPSTLKVETEDRRRKNDSGTRARSTSTSIVLPENQLELRTTNVAPSPSKLYVSMSANNPTPPAPWAPIFVTPAPPDDPSATPPPSVPYDIHPQSRVTRPRGILAAAYDFGEESISRLGRLVRPSQTRRSLQRRGSDEDSEKGLDPNEEDLPDSTPSNTASRTSEESLRRNGKAWGIWRNSEEEEDAGYFSLPPTPPDERLEPSSADFEAALNVGSLPTPALSTRSLSRAGSKKRTVVVAEGEAREGWLATVVNVWGNLGNGRRSGGKLGEVIRDLGWTVALLVGLFAVTATMVLWMIQNLPITQLKHIPKSTTDLQLLSAEIRSYMASSDAGWWHTIGVLIFVGCWKHAWSVPGAVILNILVGSLIEPMPALLLLTLITATGSLFSYLLSRPLAPLIAVLFPKPLALVRAALAPDQVPRPPTSSYEIDEKVTAVQVSADPATPPLGSEDKGSVWRRLLIMRAMGFVPWSGMNVACGVVNVDWKVFWLTTAAGSASWSYVTASVGNIVSRLAIPAAALEGGVTDEMVKGESLTSLLREPVLIAKLVFLSGLTLLPVVMKRRRAAAEGAIVDKDGVQSGSSAYPLSPVSPTSALTRSLARFTPTPAVFDLFSFGRTAVRQGGRVVLGSARTALGTARRVVGY